MLCSDLDVIWLADPRPWVRGQAETSALFAFADVIVSVDTTNDGAENDRSAWGVHAEMNTGVVFLRATQGALALCAAWVARMQQEMAKVSKMSSGFVQWWTNDQTFFNEVRLPADHPITLAPAPKAAPLRRCCTARAACPSSPSRPPKFS